MMRAIVCQGQWFSILADSTGAEFVRTGDEDYAIKIERVPLASFEQWIATGRLLDARVIAALYMVRGFLEEPSR